MTIKAPEDNVLDKLLALMGKKRRVVPPKNADEVYGKHGPYAYMRGSREGFWKALFRKKEDS